MDDLISRMAALVAIRNLYPDMPRVNVLGSLNRWRKQNEQYIKCEDVIKNLAACQYCLICDPKKSLNDEFGFKKYGINYAYPTNIIRNYTDTDIICGGKQKNSRLIDAEELKHILNNSKYYGTEAGNAFADMIAECEGR